ncbi:hypothetical protein H6P81_014293 [Aristolochia fimbriata]|uniref:non-specific serine/threonine protein kinase n=1 Tax=Aristolochia fimbriata TaxID=158543 RepID=A0AAV7EJ82_ARIFI|nr:hypothetical protein H6P81_014293 [Aristolochia fimbriata]
MKLFRRVVLRNCSISGQIPLYIASVMGSLCVLDLSFNSLSGKIPSNFDDLQSLKYLYLNNNKLTGEVLRYLNNNKLTGEVPSWVFLTPTNIDISNNDFTGSSQPSSCQIGSVNFAASYSSTNGKSTASCLKKNLPCSGKPQYYSLFINCGGSKLADKHEYEEDSSPVGPSAFFTTGRWAYSSTGHCMDNSMATFIATNASALNNANPNLYTTARTAPISLKYYGLCLLNGICTVSLHFAEIIFTADQTFSGIGRRVFDVSVQGVRVLKDFNIENRAGGPGRALVLNFIAKVTSNTLEIHLYWAGKGTTSVPFKGVYGPLISAISVTPNFVPHFRRRHKVPIGAIIGIAVAASAVALFVSVFLWVKRFFEGTILADEALKSMQLKTGYFSLKDIKAATDNFSSANKIGEGGFGPVYKGKLPDGSVIAVKQLSSKSKQGDREFLTEIGMISALQHPNLVKLYGCCAEGNQLMSIISGSVKCRLRLNWETRYKICKGIAKGLAYLHEESRLKIVHRDIKATNVLLDADLNAKISDFGLAKLAEDESTHISTRIAGTRGYMAPEYAMRGHLTSKADVYSFGVVLLEIVSGKSNTNYRNDDKFAHLLDWAIALEKEGKLLELVDPGLKSSYSAEEATRILQLALLCTNTSPNLRPSMSTVVSMLEGKVAVRVLLECGSFSEDSQKHSTVMDGPSLDSSASFANRKEKSSSIPSTSDLA